MKVFFYEKWPKIEKNRFLGIKIDLQLRFNIKKCPDFKKKDGRRLTLITPEILLRFF